MRVDAGQTLIPVGHVDERSIEDVKPSELVGYRQCHFFAGIGGWAYALRLAGWPDDREVWTGSCPCQPFSAAGKGAGFADERHLWPAFFHLIRTVCPQQIFGEQVANALPWTLFKQTWKQKATPSERLLWAHTASAPRIRQRLYWVAESTVGNATGGQSTAERELTAGQADYTGRTQGDSFAAIRSEDRRLWANASSVRRIGSERSPRRCWRDGRHR